MKKPFPTRALALASLALAPFAGCDCGPEEVIEIAPQIYIDVCKTPEHKVAGVLVGGTEDCAVDFGERDISVKVSRTIKLTNPSKVELVFHNVELIGDPAFQIELQPDVIGPGFTGDIEISVRPNVEAVLETTLFILTDANNTFQTPEQLSLVEIPIKVTGVNNGVPDIQVTPPNCDYGRVPFGGVQLCDVTIKNTGNRGLVIDSVLFMPIDPEVPEILFDVPSESTRVIGPECNDGALNCAFAFTGAPPSPDEEIAPAGGQVIMPVRFTPDVLGNFQGTFRILSSDPDESQIDVALSGISVTPPTCEIRVKSLNGAEIEAGTDVPAIEPLDNVILTIDGSEASSTAGTIVRQEWAITDQPAGSHAELTTNDLPDTGFEFDDGDDLGVDLAGEYCVSAQVFDDLGVGSVNECTLCFDVIPKDNFLVQLSWDTPVNDIDLHVTKLSDDGQYCIDATSFGTDISNSLNGNPSFFSQDCDSGLDCNYAGCKSGGGGAPEWDGLPGRTEGDPSLDIDDLSGFGPENINVDVMTPGMYLIGVNGFSGSIPSGCTIRIFVFGQLAGELFNEVSDNTWWEVALVRWPDGVETTRVCVEDLTDGTSGDQLDACDELEAQD
jgi:hypothetical protein